MMTEEPVRGSIPPPWFGAMPEIDRMRAFSHGLLPLPPLSRLLGIRPAHVGPGSGMWTMPSSGWLESPTGLLEISAVIGECEIRGRDVTGMAVHVAARVEAASSGGEVFMSGIVKDLVGGSGMHSEDRGAHTSRGVQGEWRLYALAR